MTTMRKITTYTIYGGASAAIEFIAFTVLHETIANIYITSVLSFSCGLVSSFLFNKFIVFKKKGVNKMEFLQFLTLGLANSQLSSLMTMGLALVVPPILAKAITIVVIAGWNFTIMNAVIFRKDS